MRAGVALSATYRKCVLLLSENVGGVFVCLLAEVSTSRVFCVRGGWQLCSTARRLLAHLAARSRRPGLRRGNVLLITLRGSRSPWTSLSVRASLTLLIFSIALRWSSGRVRCGATRCLSGGSIAHFAAPSKWRRLQRTLGEKSAGQLGLWLPRCADLAGAPIQRSRGRRLSELSISNVIVRRSLES